MRKMSINNIFDEHLIVEEKTLTNLIVEGQSGHTKFSGITQFAALEFEIITTYTTPTTTYTYSGIGVPPCPPSNPLSYALQLRDVGNGCQSVKVPLAHIIQWRWNEKGEQKIAKSVILIIGAAISFSILTNDSIIVRVLKKREIIEHPFPPISSPGDDLTIHIGDSEVVVSAHWLMSISPVINRMLSVEMREKHQRSLILDELGVDMELFMEFLENISPIALHQPIHLNPNNVLMLLNLAEYFQVDWLKLRCQSHLVNCVEIPLIDRFLLIDRYQLEMLKTFFMCIPPPRLRDFFRANRQQLSAGGVVCKELLSEFTFRLCE